jgi:hypothetical protein
MKKILPFIAIIAIALFAFKPLAESLPIGADLPKADLKMKDISGKEIS